MSRFKNDLAAVYAVLTVQLLIAYFSYEYGKTISISLSLIGWILVPLFIPDSQEKNKKTGPVKNVMPLIEIKQNIKTPNETLDALIGNKNKRKSSSASHQTLTSIKENSNDNSNNNNNNNNNNNQSKVSRVNTRESSSTKKPVIPLLIKDMCNPKQVTIEPNSRKPISFENQWLKGSCLLKFKSDPPDPFYEPYFEGKKRTFEVQLQGKFKQSTAGRRVFLGIEVQEQVVLGIIGKGLASLILKLLNNVVKGCYTCFGTKDGLLKPTIMLPLENSVDRMIIHKAGDEIPPLGVHMLPEEKSLSKSVLAGTKLCFNTEDTYSFSIHGMYIDFIKWQVCNLPGMKPIDFKSFWGDQPMSLVSYTVDENYDGPHTPDKKNILFRFEMKSFWNNESGWEEEVEAHPALQETQSIHSLTNIQVDYYADIPRNSQLKKPSNEILRRSVDLTPFSEVEIPFCVVGVNSFWYCLQCQDTKGTHIAALRTSESFCLIVEKTEKVVSLHVPKSPPPGSSEAVIERYREEAHEFLKLFVNEREYNVALRWLIQGYDENEKLLRASKKDYKINVKNIVKEGIALVSISETQWFETWLYASSNVIIASHPQLKHVLTVDFKEILKLTTENFECAEMFFGLQIHTLGRVYYILLASNEDRDAWIKIIETLSQEAGEGAVMTDPRETYVIKSNRWGGSERMIFNCRTQNHSHREFTCDPTVIIDVLLRMVLNLKPDGPTEKLREFLDASAQLKQIRVDDLCKLDENEALAFYLNVYHCLVAHSLLFLGQPNSSRRAVTFFNVTSYQFYDFVLSLKELEHCILRASLSAPSVILKHLLPKKFNPSDKRHRLQLTSSDFRINFALNWGNIAYGNKVPIFDPSILSRQLDLIAKRFLSRSVVVNIVKKRISLPKVCGWYQNDMGGSKTNVLQTITRYLSDNVKEMIQSIPLDQLSIKYAKFNWDFVENLEYLSDWEEP